MEAREVLGVANKLRTAQHAEGLTAGTLAAISRGIVARTRPAALSKNGGVQSMGRTWANYMLRQEDWSCYASTSDRAVPLNEILDASRGFFTDLVEHIPVRELTS